MAGDAEASVGLLMNSRDNRFCFLRDKLIDAPDDKRKPVDDSNA